MSNLHPVDSLTGLRAALSAPEPERLDVFRARVMEALKPFWEPFMGWGPPQPAADHSDPALNAARKFAYYSPEHDVAAGLAALDRLEAAGTWPACVAALERGWAALDPAGHGVALEQLYFTFVLGDPKVMQPAAGNFTGFGAVPGTVIVMAWPTPENLSLLPGAVAHELNHNLRFSFEPFPRDMNVALGQYLVAEGLAESFAAELFGPDRVGPVSNALTPEQFAALKPRFAAAVNTRGFDVVRGYIFGDWAAEQFGYARQGLPNFAGYTIGFRLVQTYLERAGRSAAAATYTPWEEIVEESRFFA
jgi:uncharacterized protein YjaZ